MPGPVPIAQPSPAIPAFDPAVPPSGVMEIPRFDPDPAAVAGLMPQAPPAAPPVAIPVIPGGAPPAAPGAAPAIPPMPTDPVAGAAQNVQSAQVAGAEGVAAVEAQNAAKAQQDADKAQHEADKAKALQDFQTRQATHRQMADVEIAKKRAKYEAAPYHTVWETRTIGQEAVIALGLILGGVSWNENHVNRGLTQLNDAINRNLEEQKQKHADLWRDLQESIEGRKDLDGRQLKELSDWQAKEAAMWDAIAVRTNAMIGSARGRGDLAAAKKVAAESQEKANAAWEHSINAAATAKHLEADTLRIKAATGKLQRRPGTGGGGGSLAALDAMEQASNAKDASLLSIAKAGRKSGLSEKAAIAQAKTVWDSKRKGAGDEAKGDAVAAKEDAKKAALAVHNPRTGDLLGHASTSERAKQADKELKDLLNVRNDIEVLKDHVVKEGAVAPFSLTSASRQRKTLAMNLVVRMSSFKGLGAISKDDRQILEGLVNGGAPAILGMSAPQLDALMKTVDRAEAATIRSQGIKTGGGGGGGGGQVPAGAKLGTQKSTGKRGYLLNGVFTPLEGG